MKIESIDFDTIHFDNGNTIEWWHNSECCEEVYADFEQLDDLARLYDYSENLTFEEGEYGFRFGDKRRMFFVPCYNIQSGYYSGEIKVLYNGKVVLTYDTPITGYK